MKKLSEFENNLSDYEWFKDEKDCLWAKDKDGEKYILNENEGTLFDVGKVLIIEDYSVANHSEVREKIAKGKEYKKSLKEKISWVSFDLLDYEWYEYSPEWLYAKGKDGKEYRLSDTTGELFEVPKGSIQLDWFGATDEQVVDIVIKAKENEKTAHLGKHENKILRKIKIILFKIKKKFSKPEIPSPKTTGFTTYYERISHGLELTNIMFTEKDITITDSTDWFDSNSERNEYYIITPDNYLKLIEKLEKEYKPMPIKKLSSYTKGYYKLFENENLKKIFLLFLSLIGYNKKVKDEEENYMRGEEIIKLLCGDEIKYKKQIYSK